MKNFTLTFLEEKFIKNGTTTTCLLYCRYCPMNIEDLQSTIFDEVNKKFNYEVLNFKCVGVSKVCPNDTYDEIKGRHIAESKAKSQAYKRALNISQYTNECLNKYLSKNEDSIKKFEYLYNAEVKHINELGDCEQ